MIELELVKKYTTYINLQTDILSNNNNNNQNSQKIYDDCKDIIKIHRNRLELKKEIYQNYKKNYQNQEHFKKIMEINDSIIDETHELYSLENIINQFESDLNEILKINENELIKSIKLEILIQKFIINTLKKYMKFSTYFTNNNIKKYLNNNFSINNEINQIDEIIKKQNKHLIELLDVNIIKFSYNLINKFRQDTLKEIDIIQNKITKNKSSITKYKEKWREDYTYYKITDTEKELLKNETELKKEKNKLNIENLKLNFIKSDSIPNEYKLFLIKTIILTKEFDSLEEDNILIKFIEISRTQKLLEGKSLHLKYKDGIKFIEGLNKQYS